MEPPGSNNTVTECTNEEVGVRLDFRSNVRKGPNRACRIQYQTADNTATGKRSPKCSVDNILYDCSGTTFIIIFHFFFVYS